VILSYNLALGVGEVFFDLPVDVPLLLGFGVDASEVHAAYRDWSWRPQVIDPTLPASASVGMDGFLVPFSLQIVPEPGTLAMCGLGLVSICVSRRRRYIKATPRNAQRT
jgi:hypothetical protein